MTHVELTLKRISKKRETIASRIQMGSTNEARPNCQVTAAVKPREATFTPSRKPLSHTELRYSGNQWVRDGDEDEGGEKNTKSRDKRPRYAAKDVADKGSCCEHRAGRDLPNGDGVNQLFVSKPAKTHNKICTEESKQDISASIKHSANLEKGEE